MPRVSRRVFNSAPAPASDRSILSTTTSTRCFCRNCSANLSIGSVRRAAKMRFACWSARSVANSTPNPLDAPVTSAHLPLTLSIPDGFPFITLDLTFWLLNVLCINLWRLFLSFSRIDDEFERICVLILFHQLQIRQPLGTLER